MIYIRDEICAHRSGVFLIFDGSSYIRSKYLTHCIANGRAVKGDTKQDARPRQSELA